MKEKIIKNLESGADSALSKLREDFKSIRGNRPSVEALEKVPVNLYEQVMTIQQLGSLSVVPPREVQIQVWDQKAVGPIMKAIEKAELGFSVSNNENVIRATLSALTDERREDISRQAKKKAEEIRIQVRNHRDEAMKEAKSAKEKGEITEDDFFEVKEEIQEKVDEANKEVEKIVEAKLAEIAD